ncbi:aldose 1-epimerase family protein [Lactobacillus sp. PV037]|uniref:aldose 1-epimerase family protein n=1 Tax=unclassified Lactobacillus TaxID=2620435 RepID=UPI00223EDA3D|nr:MULTISPECIES: aldose 1-epimerase family protein [unclassified Lactobacillus]QNQ82345.1 aldose 1-epimerase family protein [Lactobacillus sp. PV012]QNQ83542.1 aldose 1-epimerase family protein [Lactobacillus sp. PV037]
MEYRLKNDFLTVTISDHGAEIQSIVDNETQTEYIWQANPKVWKRHAPILFPIVGALKDNQYFYKDKIYNMSQHGFARDMNFRVENASETSITFLLQDTPETLKNYPFKFELRVTYTLSNNSVEENFEVINQDTKEMIFGIGGHPAFNLPTNQEIKKDDYYFKFAPSVEHMRIPLKAPLLDWSKRSQAATDSLIKISDLLFKEDAWVLELRGKNEVSVATDKNNYQVSIKMDAPYVGLWSQYPQTADYVCIEPWWGIADILETKGHLEDKKGMNHLAAGKTWKAGFVMTFQDKNK